MLTDRLNFFQLFLIFVAINSVATNVNHIDDTDETFGYWEPLHHLLYDQGMQTWEYSSQYAIRTYAFLLPLQIVGEFLRFSGVSQSNMFMIMRNFIGIFSSYCEACLVFQVDTAFKGNIGTYSFFFIVFSAGIFFTSTSFLPSSICSSLLLLSVSSWLDGKRYMTILWGCVAVLWSGWPFVGVLFLPLGVDMLLEAVRWHPRISASSSLFSLIGVGICLLIFTELPVLYLDYLQYGKWTCPPFNIFVYNAIGATDADASGNAAGTSGDELYGVEPLSYYLKNLVLTMGTAWPLAILSPFVYLVASFLIPRPVGEVPSLESKETKKNVETPCFVNSMTSPLFSSTLLKWNCCILASSVLLWILIVFPRPHKEERFLYPIYHLLAFLAAVSVECMGVVCEAVAVWCFPRSDRKGAVTGTSASLLPFLCVCCVGLVTAAMMTSRVASNYSNYSGYLHTWSELQQELLIKDVTRTVDTTICIGGDWYTFPSHFFIPRTKHAIELKYVHDSFHGLLPGYFGSNSTFNNQNNEEMSRYVDDPLAQCDYFVSTVHMKESGGKYISGTWFRDDSKGSYDENHSLEDNIVALSHESRKRAPLSEVTRATSEILDPLHSSTLFRAFYVPYFSQKYNFFDEYRVYYNHISRNNVLNIESNH